MCRGKFVVLQDDAHNLLGIINRGSPRSPLDELARELFWFCLGNKIIVLVEWVPRELNSFADEISKMLLPDDSMLSSVFFQRLDVRWGPHTCDVFASNANNVCEQYYSLYGCRGTAGVNAFGQDLS
jgi:hypothetical protein